MKKYSKLILVTGYFLVLVLSMLWVADIMSTKQILIYGLPICFLGFTYILLDEGS